MVRDSDPASERLAGWTHALTDGVQPPPHGETSPTATETRMSPSDFVEAHRDDSSSEIFGIAEICAEFEISARALRFYEEKGLLTPRRVNSTRIYNRKDRARLSLILRGQSIGASLAVIKEYLDLYGDHGEGHERQLTYVIEKTNAAIAELEVKAREIERTLAEMRLINAESRAALAARSR
jgi:DNA-binding transcriptional MerR regulator